MPTIIGRFVKGFVIGVCMLVPGVSGGSMAIVMGVYNEMISAVSHLTDRFRVNTLILSQFLLGGLVGIFLMSKPMLKLISLWEFPVMYFFMGAILASILPLYKNVRVAKIKFKNIIVATIGLLIGLAMLYIPKEFFNIDSISTPYEFLLMLMAGIILAIALILPGISGSYVLLIFGLYSTTLQAIESLDFFFLSPIIIGVVVGTLLTTKTLDYLMNKHPQFIYMLIIGFVLGSVVQLFPGLPPESQLIYSLIGVIAGFAGVIVLSLLSKKL